MKTVLLVFLSTIATITFSYAQNADPRKKFYFGVKAGYNYSNVYDTQGETFETDAKLGISAGVFTSIPIGQFVGLQPEILFSQRGFRGTGTLLGSPYELTRTTSYIDLPVLIALKPNKFFTVLAGPQFSYTLKRKDVFTNSVTSTQQEEEFSNDNIRRNTLCLLGGVDINMHPVVLGIRAGFDLQKNNGDETSTTPCYKNVWLQAAIGFRF